MLRTIVRVGGVGIALGTALAVSAGTLGGLWDSGAAERRTGPQVPSTTVAAASLPDLAMSPPFAAPSASVAAGTSDVTRTALGEPVSRQVWRLVALAE